VLLGGLEQSPADSGHGTLHYRSCELGSLVSGSRAVASISTIALSDRMPICWTIFTPSASELIEQRAR
jgi:hypothetical protein